MRLELEQETNAIRARYAAEIEHWTTVYKRNPGPAPRLTEITRKMDAEIREIERRFYLAGGARAGSSRSVIRPGTGSCCRNVRGTQEHAGLRPRSSAVPGSSPSRLQGDSRDLPVRRAAGQRLRLPTLRCTEEPGCPADAQLEPLWLRWVRVLAEPGRRSATGNPVPGRLQLRVGASSSGGAVPASGLLPGARPSVPFRAAVERSRGTITN